MNKSMMESLINQVIKVDRGGPESRIGILLAFADDYFTLLTEQDGVVYYKIHHVKSITLNSRDNQQLDLEVPETLDLQVATDFKSIVQGMKLQWVKINRGGPETLEGIMQDVDDDYISIISKDEIIRHSMFHIRNISAGSKSENENENENEKSSEQAKKGQQSRRKK